jgi:hypothetical protein
VDGSIYRKHQKMPNFSVCFFHTVYVCDLNKVVPGSKGEGRLLRVAVLPNDRISDRVAFRCPGELL